MILSLEARSKKNIVYQHFFREQHGVLNDAVVRIIENGQHEIGGQNESTY